MSSPLTRLAVAFIISLASCSPLSSSYEPRSLESRGINCVDAAAVFDTSCWDTLNIPKFLNDPVTGWKKTTPTCTPTDSGAACCHANEPWSTCFLRLYSGRLGTDCSDIAHIRNECQLQSPASTLAPSIAASARYVVYGIVSIGRLFESIASTLRAAEAGNGKLQDNLRSLIVNKANSVSSNQTAFDTALSLGPIALAASSPVALAPTPSLTFIKNLPSAKSADNPLNALHTSGRTFLQSLHQAPTVPQAIWSPSTGASGDFQHGLSLIMNDASTFIAFASNGTFSGSPAPTFTGGELPLLASTNVYEASWFLQQNGWYAIPGPMSTAADTLSHTDDHDLGDGGIAWTQGVELAAGYRSPVTNRTYTLRYGGPGKPSTSQTDMLGQLNGILRGSEGSANYGVVATPALFDWAYNCTFEGKAGGALVAVGADGSVDMACMSVLPMRLVEGSPCPEGAKLDGEKCPFGYLG